MCVGERVSQAREPLAAISGWRSMALRQSMITGRRLVQLGESSCSLESRPVGQLSDISLAHRSLQTLINSLCLPITCLSGYCHDIALMGFYLTTFDQRKL